MLVHYDGNGLLCCGVMPSAPPEIEPAGKDDGLGAAWLRLKSFLEGSPGGQPRRLSCDLQLTLRVLMQGAWCLFSCAEFIMRNFEHTDLEGKLFVLPAFVQRAFVHEPT